MSRTKAKGLAEHKARQAAQASRRLNWITGVFRLRHVDGTLTPEIPFCGPEGTGWGLSFMSDEGGFVVSHLPTGTKATSFNSEVVALVFIQSLAIHAPMPETIPTMPSHVGRVFRGLIDAINGLGEQHLLLATAELMNRNGITMVPFTPAEAEAVDAAKASQ